MQELHLHPIRAGSPPVSGNAGENPWKFEPGNSICRETLRRAQAHITLSSGNLSLSNRGQNRLICSNRILLLSTVRSTISIDCYTAEEFVNFVLFVCGEIKDRL
jgi:hypothetical protein